MEIRLPYGTIIHCLPDNARCGCTGESPLEMDKCPIFNFDDLGILCVPELCEEYKEELGEHEDGRID